MDASPSTPGQAKTVLLLLSGGKDSYEALRRLKMTGAQVFALCIDGIQGQEKEGALIAARELDTPLEIVTLPYFDETTWNPFKLMVRDLGMAYCALKTAKKVGAQAIAAGVKRSDVDDPRLWWLRGFLKAMGATAKVFGLELIYPVWDGAHDAA